MPARFRFPGPPRPDPARILIRGTVIDAPSAGELRVREAAEVSVNVASGEIERIAVGREQWTEREDGEVVAIAEGCVVVPGFVDCHVHAPQYRQLGTKTDVPLMEWLNKYTFPAEAKFSSPAHAEKVYTALVRRLLLNGTTTALYFGSNHLSATQTLALLCAAYGQRALVGKTCSDQLVPDYYVETTVQSLADTETFVGWCREKWGAGGLVQPVITPRFVPTCSSELLEGLGKLAAKHDCHVQTHAAESYDQVALVRSQWPELQRDIRILRHTNLLTPKMVLAHCCHLDDDEVREIARAGSGIASCPYSNMLFAGRILPIPRFRGLGAKVGLGTDIAGGHDSWMGSAVRQAVLADRVDKFGPPAEKREETVESVDWRYACYLATRGGAQTLGLENVGVFEVGMQWDAVLVDLAWVDEEEDGERNVEERFERWMCSHGGPHGVVKVWVGGKEVVTRTSVEF